MMMSHSSSDSQEPVKQLSALTPIADSSEMMNTAGPTTVSLISKAVAMLKPLTYLLIKNLKSLTQSDSEQSSKMSTAPLKLEKSIISMIPLLKILAPLTPSIISPMSKSLV